MGAMGTSVIRLDSINGCNKFFDSVTRHPLVSLIDFSNADCEEMLLMDFYSVWLKETPRCSCCGWKESDFSDGTIVFLTPNKPMNMDIWRACKHEKGWLLAFHPSLLQDTHLASELSRYSFFRYKLNEALHLSAEERRIMTGCMESIAKELAYGVDEYSKCLLVNKIELVLNHCARFYQRQFITRHELNLEILAGTDRLISDYFPTGATSLKGRPDINFFSGVLGLSPAYFADLIKHETGKTFSEYIEESRLHPSSDLPSHEFYVK